MSGPGEEDFNKLLTWRILYARANMSIQLTRDKPGEGETTRKHAAYRPAIFKMAVGHQLEPFSKYRVLNHMGNAQITLGVRRCFP